MFGIGHVAGESQRLAAQGFNRLDRLLTTLGAAGVERDFGALARHGQSRRATDAGAAASNQGYSVF